MTREVELLNLLLDRYERSGHCLPEKESGRRVALSFSRGEYPPYRENDPCAGEVNCAVKALADRGLVAFTWRKGYEGWLLDKVYLELNTLPQAYAEAGRLPLRESAEFLREMLSRAEVSIQTPWKRRFLGEEAARLQKNLRPSRLLSGERSQVNALLQVLQYTESGPELMRVISANCFHDSKYLERNLLPHLTSIAKAYEPELVAYRTAGDEMLTQSVVLEQLGILTYPEIFEFCGDIRLHFPESSLTTAAFQRGFCLQSENLERLSGASLDAIKTVLFVENRTNYRSLALQGVPHGTLVVHHGGFYSPAKRKLFRMFAEGMCSAADARFWGDIDLGGFLMFTRLKRNLFPNLTPWKMGVDDYSAYKKYGVPHPPAYFATLQQRMSEGQFDCAFFPVAQRIVENGMTVEQEIML